jgi:hypothetical protein
LLSTLATDIPIPEFDHIGMEALPIETLFNERSTEATALIDNIPVLGYSPRYIAYKTSVDWVSGAFETTLDSWVAPLTVNEQITKLLFNPDSGSVYSMNYGFFKVTPRVLDPIFVQECTDTWDSDQFLVNVSFNVKPETEIPRELLTPIDPPSCFKTKGFKLAAAVEIVTPDCKFFNKR